MNDDFLSELAKEARRKREAQQAPDLSSLAKAAREARESRSRAPQHPWDRVRDDIPSASPAQAATGAAARNPDGTYGQPPDGFVVDPQTGQYTTREWMANNLPTSRGRSAVDGALQGLTFGGFDEAAGLVGGDFAREYSRARVDAARRDHPVITGASEAAGGATTALSYGLPAMAGRGIGGASAAGAGIGALEGAAYGFLSGEGGAQERAENIPGHALIGAGAGAAAPSALRGLDYATRPIRTPIATVTDRVIGRGSHGRASRALDSTMRRAGMSPDDVDFALRQAAGEGQPEFRAADALGVPGQRRLSGVTRSGDDGATEIADFLNQRQIDQPERLAGFIEDAFDASRSAADTQSALRTARGQAADAAYGAARQDAGPVDVRGALDVIDRRIGGMQGSGVAGDSIDAKLVGFKRRLAADPARLPEGTSARELSDFDRVLGVKQDAQDAAQAAYRAGRSNEGRELDRLWRSLDGALEDASPSYRQANDAFRESSRVIDAVETGQRAARPGQRATDTVDQFSAMTPDQQAAARVGYGDRTLARIESTAGEGTNRARPLTSTKFRREAGEMAVDPDLLDRRIGRENTMFETRNRAVGGSRTADNLSDISDLQPYDVGVIANLLTGRWGTAASQVSGGLSDVFTGMNPQTRKIIADALMAQDASGLRSAAQRQGVSEAQRRIIETLARITSVQNVDPNAMLPN